MLLDIHEHNVLLDSVSESQYKVQLLCKFCRLEKTIHCLKLIQLETEANLQRIYNFSQHYPVI